MKNWKDKLDIFLAGFEHATDIVGVLVCGSYITGQPTPHSDLDVHIVLDNKVNYRERGNKIIDGLLIEYFANPYKQIVSYFNDDLHDKSLMCQTQFATGKIIIDKVGDVQLLKEEATSMIANFYDASQTVPFMSELEKYFLWDMLDDMQDAYETQRPDYDFLYYTRLNMLLEKYFKCINLPYNTKSIYGSIVDANVRKKYLLGKLPDEGIGKLIVSAITATARCEKIDAYVKLTTAIFDCFGGFCVDGFKLKSDVEV